MKKLLLIDDEAIVCKSLSSQFDHEIVQVFTAANGEDGLKIALEEKPDLIIVDLLMPKMDGLQMLEKLRADHWGRGAAVIVLSNYGDEERSEQAKQFDVDDYLVKVNWNVADVVAKINKKLGLAHKQ